MLVTENETDAGFDFACFLDGIRFMLTSEKRVSVGRNRCSQHKTSPLDYDWIHTGTNKSDPYLNKRFPK